MSAFYKTVILLVLIKLDYTLIDTFYSMLDTGETIDPADSNLEPKTKNYFHLQVLNV